MTDRDRLAEDLEEAVPHADCLGKGVCASVRGDWTLAADRLIARGWTRLDEAGTRLIRVGYDLKQFGARTADGRLLTAEWREPLDDGTYEPLFTATDDGMTLLASAELARLRSIEEAARASHPPGEVACDDARLHDALGSER